AAVTAALTGLVRAGDHIVSSRALFGSCRYVVEEHLPRFGVESTLVDGRDLAAWRAAVRPNTRAFFLESPSNPTLEIIDIAAVAKIAHAAGAKLVVDNVFATALWQQPLKLGADCVVYSATKHIDGQGRCLGGVILASQAFIDEHVHTLLRQTGPAMSPFNAWVLLKSLETFPLRLRRQSETAVVVADWLAGHPRIGQLRYPGRKDHPDAALIARQMQAGSTLMCFEVGDSKASAYAFLNRLNIIRISNNLGDAKSLAVHPATTTHQRFTPAQRQEMGVLDSLVRLSIGLEHPDDLIADLRQALEA
ncbi:MAG TPA: PLP-dependent transferase, partial [Beijerinckiaceae bacterium]|nr:PLP-dependent transferase [Beijerinckiaceae bacterium]